MGSGTLLLALDFDLGPTPEIVLLGGENRQATVEALAFLRRQFLPNKVVAFRDPSTPSATPSPSLSAIYAGKQSLGPGPTLFVCENFSCQSPVSGEEVVRKLKGLYATVASGA